MTLPSNHRRVVKLLAAAMLVHVSACQGSDEASVTPVDNVAQVAPAEAKTEYSAKDAELDWQAGAPQPMTVRGAKAHPDRPSMPLLGAKRDACRFENCNLSDGEPD